MRTWNKMTKTKAIMNHLQEYGNITTWEAIKEYGVTRLSAIIYNLRYKYNMNIVNQTIDFVDRYGTNSSFVKYVYIKENQENE